MKTIFHKGYKISLTNEIAKEFINNEGGCNFISCNKCPLVIKGDKTECIAVKISEKEVSESIFKYADKICVEIAKKALDFPTYIQEEFEI